MQAIDIRCDFAKSKILQLVHGDAVDCPIGGQIEAATELGQFDFDKRSYQVPQLFKDEPILIQAWQDGQQFAKEMQEYDEAQADAFYASMGPPKAWEGDGWSTSCDGRYETKPFVVKTDDGYCAGFYVSNLGGEPGTSSCGSPQPTLELAIKEAHIGESEWHREDCAPSTDRQRG